jgi:hypothetical protein
VKAEAMSEARDEAQDEASDGGKDAGDGGVNEEEGPGRREVA